MIKSLGILFQMNELKKKRKQQQQLIKFFFCYLSLRYILKIVLCYSNVHRQLLT